jgi:hypothetical protein
MPTQTMYPLPTMSNVPIDIVYKLHTPLNHVKKVEMDLYYPNILNYNTFSIPPSIINACLPNAPTCTITEDTNNATATHKKLHVLLEFNLPSGITIGVWNQNLIYFNFIVPQNTSITSPNYSTYVSSNYGYPNAAITFTDGSTTGFFTQHGWINFEQVNSNPVDAGFSYQQSSCNPTITFTSNATSNGNPNSYVDQWEFGDDLQTTLTGSPGTVQHTYNNSTFTSSKVYLV